MCLDLHVNSADKTGVQRWIITFVAVLMLPVVRGNDLFCEVDDVLTPYDTNTYVCCSGLHLKYLNGTGTQCCAGKTLYDIGTHGCCGPVIYELAESRMCCNGTLHDMKEIKTRKLACCGNQVFFEGAGICCDGQFTRRPGNATRMECRDGKGVVKQERHLQFTKANGVQLRELDSQDGRIAKTCRNNVMIDQNLPQGSEITSRMLVLDGVKQCGQIVYPIQSSTKRYHCCNGEFYKTDNLDPKANYTWECCGTSLYNTSSKECCGGTLIDTSLQPIGCCNGALVYTKSYQRCCGGQVVDKIEYLCHKPVTSSSGIPVRKQDDDHNNACYDYKTKIYKTFNDAKWICHEGMLISPDDLIDSMEKDIFKESKWDVDNHIPKKNMRFFSPMCPFTECETGFYNRTTECRKITRLDFFLHNMTEHNGRLVLSGIVTYPNKFYGSQLTINSVLACRDNCFAKRTLISIYTNRFTKTVPSKVVRLSKRDIVVKTHTASISCTIDPWAKRTEKSP
ncbi:uncharacterized protein LOC127843956 [Dreissena polymorpha]|uniref:Galaxin-like repeats domain-containing protein n=1 Tax=Dreissena polymorpha TaxID=45954 RepID=A0A9D4EC70_DREPO|nr:uncharacterized protein LOC127843956 [Dreissena polymorpha]KAH3776036.1 hypothetical protein DPMN_177448 [Dreissena polymorpha]